MSYNIWVGELPFPFECGDDKFGKENHTSKYIIASLEQPQSMLGIPMPDTSTHHNSQRNYVSHNPMSLHSMILHLNPIFHQTSIGNSVNASIGIYINIPKTHKQIHIKSCFNAEKMHMFSYFNRPLLSYSCRMFPKVNYFGFIHSPSSIIRKKSIQDFPPYKCFSPCISEGSIVLVYFIM